MTTRKSGATKNNAIRRSPNKKTAASTKTSKYGTPPRLSGGGSASIKELTKAKTPNAAVKPTATNVWSTLTDTNLATVDVYKQLSSGTINSLSDFANTFNFDLGGLLKGGSEILSKFKKAQEAYVKIKDAVNQGISLDRLGSLGDTVKHGLASLGVDQKSDLFKAIESTNVFLSRVGDSYKVIKNVNWNDANSITNMVNTLAGTKVIDLSDIGAEAQYMVKLINTMSEHGISGAVDALKDLIRANPLAHDIVKGVLPRLLQNGDAKSVVQVINIASKEVVTSTYGDLLKTFSQNYGSNEKDNRSLKEGFVDFIALSDSLGSYGIKSTLNGKPVLNFSSILNGSESFNKMVLTNAKAKRDDYQYLAMVSEFADSTVEDTIRKQFPRAVITKPYSQTGNVLLGNEI